MIFGSPQDAASALLVIVADPAKYQERMALLKEQMDGLDLRFSQVTARENECEAKAIALNEREATLSAQEADLALRLSSFNVHQRNLNASIADCNAKIAEAQSTIDSIHTDRRIAAEARAEAEHAEKEMNARLNEANALKAQLDTKLAKIAKIAEG
jgi:chromosome segregation ATPase